MSEHSQVPLRALFEHFKSTDEDPKWYVTLDTELIDGVEYVWYMPLYEHGVMYPRPTDEFNGMVTRDGITKKRFRLLAKAVITLEERDALLDASKPETD